MVDVSFFKIFGVVKIKETGHNDGLLVLEGRDNFEEFVEVLDVKIFLLLTFHEKLIIKMNTIFVNLTSYFIYVSVP